MGPTNSTGEFVDLDEEDPAEFGGGNRNTEIDLATNEDRQEENRADTEGGGMIPEENVSNDDPGGAVEEGMGPVFPGGPSNRGGAGGDLLFADCRTYEYSSNDLEGWMTYQTLCKGHSGDFVGSIGGGGLRGRRTEAALDSSDKFAMDVHEGTSDMDNQEGAKAEPRRLHRRVLRADTF